jgi:prepilin-type N-terminal cleavage/methylation domain-containing protein
MRRAFTLIEVLIALMLVGIGVTACILLISVAIAKAQRITAMTTMGPVATSAAAYCAAYGLDGTAPVDLPAGPFVSPYALRVDTVPAADVVAIDGLGALDAAGRGRAGKLVTYRVRLYDDPESREAAVRLLGTIHVRAYLRTRTTP